MLRDRNHAAQEREKRRKYGLEERLCVPGAVVSLRLAANR
jgi:hypothetical protein